MFWACWMCKQFANTFAISIWWGDHTVCQMCSFHCPQAVCQTWNGFATNEMNPSSRDPFYLLRKHMWQCACCPDSEVSAWCISLPNRAQRSTWVSHLLYNWFLCHHLWRVEPFIILTVMITESPAAGFYIQFCITEVIGSGFAMSFVALELHCHRVFILSASSL